MTIGRVWFPAGVTQDLEIVAFESAEAFQAWLGENHAVSSGIWLKLRTKDPGFSRGRSHNHVGCRVPPLLVHG